MLTPMTLAGGLPANLELRLLLRWCPSSCSLWGTTPGSAFPPGVGCRRRDFNPHGSPHHPLKCTVPDAPSGPPLYAVLYQFFDRFTQEYDHRF
jgi:hypothetical protein